MEFTNMSFEQFKSHFSTEEACISYISQTKWPNGFVCPRCNQRHAYVTGTRRLPLYECSHCRHQTSLIAQTVMEGSRTVLRKWLLALFLISRTDEGTNAVELCKLLQVTYKTAWSMLHKIRKMMHRTEQQVLLTGSVSINSAIYGRPYNPSVNKHPQEHLLLVGASLNKQNDPACLKIKHVLPDNPKSKHISRFELQAFLKQQVQSQPSNINSVTGFYSPKRTRPLMTFAAQVSEWINETFHGLGSKYLQFYLDEFCFRFNLCLQHASVFDCLTRVCFLSNSLSQPSHTSRMVA